MELEGGVQVSGLREGEPSRYGSLRLWERIGRSHGAAHVSLRILECAPGVTPALVNASGAGSDGTQTEEVFYVFSGSGRVLLDGHAADVGPGSAVYLPPELPMSVANDSAEPLVLTSARCPDPGEQLLADPVVEPGEELGRPPSSYVTSLADQAKQPTGDRWYKTLVGPEQGCNTVTQFVGSIPPGRSPDHYHTYEEVLCVLTGEGVLWAGESTAPIAPGSCVYLPPGQRHCVENLGPGDLVLMGVFYPSGSPAVRYEG